MVRVVFVVLILQELVKLFYVHCENYLIGLSL